MRTILAFIVVFIVVCFGIRPVAAQKGLSIGFRMTPLMTTMSNQTDADAPDSIFKWTPTFGVCAGISLGYNFSNYFGIYAHALFSNQGQHNYFSFLNEYNQKIEVKNELRLRYFKFPLLLRFSTNAQKKYAFTAEIGPQLEWLSSVDERDFDPRYNGNVPPKQNRPDYQILNFPSRERTFKEVNYGIVFAPGLDIKLRYNMKIVAALRLDYTFNDVEEKNINYDFVRNGVNTVTPYYSEVTRANFGPNRAKSTNITAGISIGLNYLFLKRINY